MATYFPPPSNSKPIGLGVPSSSVPKLEALGNQRISSRRSSGRGASDLLAKKQRASLHSSLGLGK